MPAKSDPIETTPRARFAAIARLPDTRIDAAEAALWIAAEARPELDVSACRAKLAALAERAAPALAGATSTAERCARLARHLHDEEGLRGNAEDYHDPRNSHLDDVLERGLGIPITLAVIWIDVAGRLGLRAEGVGLPGHFLVRVAGDDGAEILIDAFAGRLVDLRDCEALVARATGNGVRFDAAMLRTAPPREILARMLRNLEHAHLQREELAPALACAERILLLAPGDPGARRDAELLRRALRARNARLH